MITDPELVKIVEKSLAANPADRYPSAAAMCGDIEDYLRASKLRVSSEDISKYVNQLFGEKRANMRKLIERQIAKLREETDGPTSVDSRAPVSLRSGLPRIGLEMTMRIDRAALVAEADNAAAASPSSHETRSLVASQTVPDMPAQRPMSFYALLGVGCIIAGVGTFLLLGRQQNSGNTTSATPPPVETAKSSAPQNTEKPPPDPTPAPAPAPAPVPATSSSVAASPAMMELQIMAVPTTAAIFVDGARIPTNPYTGKVPMDGMGHKVHAEARGYKSAGEIVLFSKDTSITLQLTPLNGAPAPSPDGKSPPNNQRKLDDNPYP